jgi:hypothetical protein
MPMVYGISNLCTWHELHQEFLCRGGTKTTVAILMRDILRCLGHQNHHAACYLHKAIIHKSRSEPFLWNRFWCFGWFWAGWNVALEPTQIKIKYAFLRAIFYVVMGILFFKNIVKVSWFQNVLLVSSILPRKERKKFDLRYHSSKAKFFGLFFEDLKIPQRHFEINRPLTWALKSCIT